MPRLPVKAKLPVCAVTVANALMLPAVAVMVTGVATEGDPTTRAVPALLRSLLVVTVAASEELYVTEASCCWLLLLNVPVAMNCCVAPV